MLNQFNLKNIRIYLHCIIFALEDELFIFNTIINGYATL